MKLIIGVGIVGKSTIEYFKNQKLCFYDDVHKEYKDKSGKDIPFFQTWDGIKSVIVSPGIPVDHPMIKEAESRELPIETDISIFLENEEMIGVKIAITGTNGKSTLCSLLKYILGDLAELGGNFGVSPLEFQKNSFYIIEISSYQLHWLEEDLIKKIDIGVITNIGNHHIKYHKSKSEYIRVKKKILKSKNKIYDVKKQEGIKYPKNILFEKEEYQIAWNTLLKILAILDFDEKKALKKLESYVPLKYRQEVINDNPLIVNDSKSTNVESMSCALKNMRKNFVLISQINDYDIENFDINEYLLLDKIFILSGKEITNLNKPHYVSNDFELVVKAAVEYAKEKQMDILFSPGEQSFEFFKNFENRGEIFTRIIKAIFK